jgi:hypothetical protein
MSLKSLWIIYWLLFFFIYLPLTRNPGVFSSERTKGLVVRVWKAEFGNGRRTETHVNPIVHYYVDSIEYTFVPDDNKNYFGLFSEGEEVTILYEKGNPKNAAIASLIVYWLDYIEIAMALLIISLLTIFYSAVKNWEKMKYTGSVK